MVILVVENMIYYYDRRGFLIVKCNKYFKNITITKYTRLKKKLYEYA